MNEDVKYIRVGIKEFPHLNSDFFYFKYKVDVFEKDGELEVGILILNWITLQTNRYEKENQIFMLAIRT